MRARREELRFFSQASFCSWNFIYASITTNCRIYVIIAGMPGPRSFENIYEILKVLHCLAFIYFENSYGVFDLSE